MRYSIFGYFEKVWSFSTASLSKKREEMQEKDIQSVMDILTKWNPLGEKAKNILDLNNYRTEAIDILFNIGLFQNDVVDVVQSVINGAFDLSLNKKECEKTAKEIFNIYIKL